MKIELFEYENKFAHSKARRARNKLRFQQEYPKPETFKYVKITYNFKAL